MTTTIEIAAQLEAIYKSDDWATGLCTEEAFTIDKAAKRLRELDKPDCIFTMCADDSPTPQTLQSGCDGAVLWYMGNPGENKLPNFCWHCSGAVKEST